MYFQNFMTFGAHIYLGAFCRIMRFPVVDPLRNLLLHNTRNQVTQGIGRI